MNKKNIILGTFLFLIFFLVGFYEIIPLPKISIKWETPREDKMYTPSYQTVNGKMINFIYIGCSTCSAANDKRLPQVVDSLKFMVKIKALAHNYFFSTTGISKDWIVEDGIDHLKIFGEFDQIMTGRNWQNEGIFKYVWQEFPSVPGVPQILIVKQEIVDTGNQERNLYLIKDERLIMRKLGLNEIIEWKEKNAPLSLN